MTAPTVTPHALPAVESNGVVEHKPYVPDKVVMPELTWSAVIVGAVPPMNFGAMTWLVRGWVTSPPRSE